MLTSKKLEAYPLLKQFLIGLKDAFHEPSYEFEGPIPTLGHLSLGLLLFHEICSKSYKPNYMVAGTEDLRCLLPHLNLEKENAEAIIWIRPYIHSMALYFKHTKAGLRVIFFDPQNWELVYYPNRNLFSILEECFPGITIYVTPKVQFGDGTCGVHVFNFMEAMQKENAFEDMTNWSCPDEFTVQSDSQIKYVVCRLTRPSAKVLSISENPEHEADPLKLKKLQESLYAKLDKEILPLYLSEAKGSAVEKLKTLNWQKILEVNKRLSGAHLCEPSLHPKTMYQMTLKEEKYSATLTVHLENPNQFKYGNLFCFSEAKYPLEVRDKLVMQESLPFTVVDEKACTITFRAKFAFELSHQLERLPEVVFKSAPYMRQTFALKTFSEEARRYVAKEKCKLHEKQRGIGFDVYVDALYYLMQHRKDVHVVSQYDQASQVTELLDVLSQADLPNIIFIPFEKRKEHAILIVAYPKLKKVDFYDSEGDQAFLLANIFIGYKFEAKPSHFELQKSDDPFCVAHCVMNALIIAKIQPMPKQVDELVVTDELFRNIHAAAELGSGRAKRKFTHRKQKEKVLIAVERVRKKAGDYPDKDNCKLKPFADALQIELWGNIVRNKEVGDNRNRENKANIHNDERSFADFCRTMKDSSAISFIEQISHIDLDENDAAAEVEKTLLEVFEETEAYTDKGKFVSGANTTDIMGILSLRFMDISDVRKRLCAPSPMMNEEKVEIECRVGKLKNPKILDKFVIRALKKKMHEADPCQNLTVTEFVPVGERRSKLLSPYVEAKCISEHMRDQFLTDDFYPIFCALHYRWNVALQNEESEVKPVKNKFIAFSDEDFDLVLKYLAEIKDEAFFETAVFLAFDKTYEASYDDLVKQFVAPERFSFPMKLFELLVKNKELSRKNKFIYLALLVTDLGRLRAEKKPFLVDLFELLGSDLPIENDMISAVVKIFSELPFAEFMAGPDNIFQKYQKTLLEVSKKLSSCDLSVEWTVSVAVSLSLIVEVAKPKDEVDYDYRMSVSVLLFRHLKINDQMATEKKFELADNPQEALCSVLVKYLIAMMAEKMGVAWSFCVEVFNNIKYCRLHQTPFLATVIRKFENAATEKQVRNFRLAIELSPLLDEALKELILKKLNAIQASPYRFLNMLNTLDEYSFFSNSANRDRIVGPEWSADPEPQTYYHLIPQSEIKSTS